MPMDSPETERRVDKRGDECQSSFPLDHVRLCGKIKSTHGRRCALEED